nr:HEPN domain-containing protein [Candidatus Freyarchaeota archaeon]
MKNTTMASNYIFRAQRCLREAELALSEKDYAGAVRRSQEALELAIKAVLRYLAVEYPKEHDVGAPLTEVEDRLPNYLKERLQDIQELSTELAKVRGPALYGYEREGTPARDIFGKDYAENTYNTVKEIVDLCSKFLKPVKKSFK